MWRRRRQGATALYFLVLAAIVSVDSRFLSESKGEEGVTTLKRAISISTGGGGGGTVPLSNDSREASASGNYSTGTSAKKVRVSDGTADRAGFSDIPSRSISIVTQTLLTFVTVFFFGCAIVLAIFAWKRFSESPFRLDL